jgi:deazaflavin-dependent oxidoreductase (nitroreductase family)
MSVRVLAKFSHVLLGLYNPSLGGMLGSRFLRLTHVGRKSGRRYHTVLEVIGRNDRRREVMVIAGMGRSSDWYRNIEEKGAVEIVVGRRQFIPLQRVLGEDEAAAVLRDYEHRNRLAAPVIRTVISRLVGWPYDGTDAARARLARRLPIVAFRPEPTLSA